MHTVVRSRPVLIAAVSWLSLIAGIAVVLRSFDTQAVWQALSGVDLSYFFLALAVGIGLQLLRAERAALLLRQQYPISLEHCFGAQVLSHAVENIIPIGPGGYGLQGALTRRLAGIPISFAVGVFVSCGLLENLSVLPLALTVLLTMHLPQWVRLILVGAMVRSSLILLVPVIAAATRQRLHGLSPRTGWGRRIGQIVVEMEDGLATVVAGGWRSTVPALGLSCLITAGSMLRISLFFGAVGFPASLHQLALLLVMGGLMQSVPVPLPGASAWATSKLARLVHIAGPGAASFGILTGLITAVESPIMAAGVLLWWTLPLSRVGLRLGDLVSLARHPADVA